MAQGDIKRNKTELTISSVTEISRTLNGRIVDLLDIELHPVDFSLEKLQLENNKLKAEVEKNFQLDMPKGVRGRSSNNDLIKSKIGWDASVSLKKGLEITYKWIYSEIKSGSNTNKFITKYEKN